MLSRPVLIVICPLFPEPSAPVDKLLPVIKLSPSSGLINTAQLLKVTESEAFTSKLPLLPPPAVSVSISLPLVSLSDRVVS